MNDQVYESLCKHVAENIFLENGKTLAEIPGSKERLAQYLVSDDSQVNAKELIEQFGGQDI